MTSLAMVALRWSWAGAAGVLLFTGHQAGGGAATANMTRSAPTNFNVEAYVNESNLPAIDHSESVDLARICRVTAYCDRGLTAAGTLSGVGQCAAPEDIPFGTEVYIPALDRTFIVTDRTHKRFRHNTVDLFMTEYEECKLFGRNYLECEFRLPNQEWRRPRNPADHGWTARFTRVRTTAARQSS